MKSVFCPTPHLPTFSLRLPSLPCLSARRLMEAAGLRVSEECRVLHWVSKQPGGWLWLLGVYIFPERHVVCRLPKVDLKTLTQMYSESKFMRGECTGCQPKSSLNHIRGNQTLHPKINSQSGNTTQNFKSRPPWQIIKIIGTLVCAKWPGHYVQWIMCSITL